MTLLLWTHVMYHSPPESPVFSCPFIFHRTVVWLGVTHRSCITNLLLDLYIVQLFGHSARIICDGNLGKCSWKPTRLSRLRLCLCRNTRKPARKLLDMGGSEIGCGSPAGEYPFFKTSLNLSGHFLSVCPNNTFANSHKHRAHLDRFYKL